MRPSLRSLSLLASCLCTPLLAVAQDSLLLKDTRFVTGVKMETVGDNIVIHFPHGDIAIPRSMVKESHIKGEAVDASLSDEDKSKIDQGLVKFDGKWMQVAERDKLLQKRTADREARIREAMAHRDWKNRYTLNTENFAFEYTIDPEVMKSFADQMEVYFKTFTKEWGIKKPPKLGRLKVCFYHDQDYYQQVSGAGQGVAGYFRFVEPLELNFYYDRLDLDFTREVMFHETNHYLTQLIDTKFKYPLWVNESLGEYYGASRWDQKAKKMSIGHIQEGRLAEVQDAIAEGRWQGLEQLINMTREEFGSEQYAWGWTLMHWLLENPKTEKKLKDFYMALARDKSVQREINEIQFKQVKPADQIELFKKYMDFKDLKEVEKAWHEYVKGLQPSSGRGYYEAGRIAIGSNAPLKAQRMLKIALEKGFHNPQVYATLSRAQWLKNQNDEAIESMKKALELDPLNAEYYLGLARAQGGTGYRIGEETSPEARRSQWLALEVARATNDPAEYAILIDLGPEFTKPDPALPPAK